MEMRRWVRKLLQVWMKEVQSRQLKSSFNGKGEL